MKSFRTLGSFELVSAYKCEFNHYKKKAI